MKKLLPQYFFLLLVLLVTVSFFGLIMDFMLAVFWAVILAILFYNRYEKIKAKMAKRPNLAATLTILYLLVLVIVPISLVTLSAVNQASVLMGKISEGNMTLEKTMTGIQEKMPVKEQTLKQFGLSVEQLQQKIQDFPKTGVKTLANYAMGITQNIFTLFVNLLLMLYILFFFLRDGKNLVNEFVESVPILDRDERELLSRFESTARATVKGSLVVAFVQGTIGGLLFWILGIHAALLWGALMVLASLLPIGSAIIWAPWSIVLIMQGEVTKGVILIIVGAAFIGLIDNFLRPILVGKDSKLPDYLVLLSTLGGLVWFGLSGFVIGPVVASMFVTCWAMMRKKYGTPKVSPKPVKSAKPTEKESGE